MHLGDFLFLICVHASSLFRPSWSGYVCFFPNFLSHSFFSESLFPCLPASSVISVFVVLLLSSHMSKKTRKKKENGHKCC